MRDYFLKAGVLAREASFWEEEIVGHPNMLSIRSNFADPFEMVSAFAEAHKEARLDSPTLVSIRQRLRMTNGVLANSPKAGRAVLEADEGSGGNLRNAARDARGRFARKNISGFRRDPVPRYSRFFHKYTVDEHSLIAIRNIEQLPPSHRFSLLLNELENPELLLVSLLFHDIGNLIGTTRATTFIQAPKVLSRSSDISNCPADQVEKGCICHQEPSGNVENHHAA